MSASPQSIELLSLQFSQLQSLEQVIADEKLILQQHKPDALLQISEQKNLLLLAIQELDKNISLNQAFALDKKAGLLDKEITEIENLLIVCQQKNQVNGQIIAHSQLAVQRMKTTLLEDNNKASVTYNSKGKKSGGLSSISLKT
jgi:flagella synthesis protein FlgN